MAPTRVHLGADAWALLVGALPGARLPYPFRPQDGPALDSAARTATEHALRDAELLVGDLGDVLIDMAPWLSAALYAHTRPSLVVDSTIGLGDMVRIAHHAIRGDLASGLACSQRPADADVLEIGPIELSAFDAGELAAEVARGFGTLDGEPDREAVALDAPSARALAAALADDHPDRARAAIETLGLPSPPAAAGAGLRSVARVDVATAAGRRAILALRLAGGWWIVAGSGEEVTLRPAVGVALVDELRRAL